MRKIISNSLLFVFRSKPFWVLVIIALLSNIYFFDKGFNCYGLSWEQPFKLSGDSEDYISSVEELLDGNEFHFFKTNEDKEFVSNIQPGNKNYDKGIYYAFRSPGFAFFYLPLRLVFSPVVSIYAFLVLQVIVLAFAKVYLAKLSFIFTKNNKVFYGVFLLLNITPYFSQYQNLLLTESLGFSFLIFYLYQLFKVIGEGKWKAKEGVKRLYLAGFFLIVTIMLRPFLAFFLPPVAVYLFLNFFKSNITLKAMFSFFLPIVLIGGVWIARNFIKTERFIPLASTMKFQDHKHKASFKMRKYAKQHGVSDKWFDNQSPVYWLIKKDDNRSFDEVVINLTNSEVNFFKDFKEKFHLSLSQNIPVSSRVKMEYELESSLDSLNQNFKQENFYNAVIGSRLKATKNLLMQPNLRFFHFTSYPFNVLWVTVQSFVLRLTFVVGFLCIFLLTFMKLKSNFFWLISIPLFLLIVFFGWYKQTIEFRELYTYSGLFLMAWFILMWKLFQSSKIAGGIGSLLTLGHVVVLAITQMIAEINW